MTELSKTRNECRDEKTRHTSFYTGSLIQSYVQSHLTPRWNPLKTVPITYKLSSSWTLQEQHQQCWKTLFQHTLHSKKPYQGVTNTYTFTNQNKGKITPEKKMQELKTSSSICCRNCTSTFTKIQGFLEQAHLKISLENLSKTLSILLLTWKLFDLCQKRNCSALFHVRETFLYIENNF